MQEVEVANAQLDLEKIRAEQRDSIQKERVELMYKLHGEDDSQTERIRQRFETKYQKAVTLDDIGVLLDRMIIDEEAMNAHFYDGTE